MTPVFNTKLLLVYYHPIVFDLALTFKNNCLFQDVEMAVVPNLKDNYGSHENVIEKAKSLGIKCNLIPVSLLLLKSKMYGIVGLDGVFQGDNLVISACANEKIPYFCINGYPHNVDEPSQNILSFSWYLPQQQYRSKYPHEGHVKEVDWKNIVTNKKERKNICVFYPEMRELKKWISENNDAINKSHIKKGYISLIHRFEECNKWSYEAFKYVKNLCQNGVDSNYSNLKQNEVWKLISESPGILHLKHADCPGISVLESMILSRTPIVMESFVLASQNQDLLIHNHSAIICSSLDEIVDKINNKYYLNDLNNISQKTAQHGYMMTDFDRQKSRLINFFKQCIGE